MDPAWWQHDGGTLSRHLLVEDVYFAEGPEDPGPLGDLLDRLLDGLSEDERACVELRVHAGESFQRIAAFLGWFCGDPPVPNRKRAWSVTTRALARLRADVESDIENPEVSSAAVPVPVP